MNKLAAWRTLPGFYRPGKASLKSIQALFSEFLRDRHSPSLLENHYCGKNLDSIDYGWGEASPLEKEISSQQDLDLLIRKSGTENLLRIMVQSSIKSEVDNSIKRIVQLVKKLDG